MNLRPWKFEDLSEIERLERECFPSAPWNRRALTDCFLSERFYGVLSEEGGRIAAYGGISWLLDEAEVLLIATAELYRRCGRGQEILSALLAEAKRQGAKRVFLEVRVSNAPAQMLYLKNGFAGLYARARYYPDGEDAIVMKKELI